MSQHEIETPLGTCVVTIENDALTECRLRPRRASRSTSAAKLTSGERRFLTKVERALKFYFSGKTDALRTVRVAPSGTEFQKQVWRELCRIPGGTTLSYSEMATRVGKKNGARAIGNACGRNPIWLFVPCHRVVTRSGHIGGYAGGGAIKRRLLELERALDES